MIDRNKGRSALAILVMSVSLTSLAHADADRITNPDFGDVVKPGSLDVKSYQASVSAGYTNDDRGQQGGTIQLDLSKTFLVGGSVSDDQPLYNHNGNPESPWSLTAGQAAAGFALTPNLHVRADVVAPPGGGSVVLRQLDIEGGGFALLDASMQSRRSNWQGTLEENAASGSYTRKDTEFTEKEAEKARKEGKKVERIRIVSCASMKPEEQKASSCLDGLPEDPTVWTDAQKLQLQSRSVTVYRIQDKSSTAGEIAVAQVSGIYQDRPQIGVQNAGVRAKGVSLNGQTSFKIGDVQADFCMGLSAGVMIGSLQNNGSSAPMAGDFHAKGCAGVQIGQIARVGYQADVGYDDSIHNAQELNIAQTASVSKIFNTPLNIGYTRENQLTFDANGDRSNGITTNMFTAGAAF